MCLHVSTCVMFVSANGYFCVGVHVFLEFHTCILCCLFSFCDCLLLLHHSALGVLCNSSLLVMVMCILLILVPLAFNDLLMY